MRRNSYVALLSALAVLLFAGCGRNANMPEAEETKETPERTEEYYDGPNRHDGLFTLGYDSDGGLNPFVCESETNVCLFGLMYEGAFAVTADYGYEPVLADTWESGDRCFSFTLKPGLLFSDGSEVTAWDAAYCLSRARESGSVYASRLSDVTKVECDGERVNISLKKSNTDFALLLDIPIVREGTAYDDIPVGTGPYVFTESGEERYLEAYARYRFYDDLPLKRFYIAEYPRDERAAAFAERMLDFAVNSVGESDIEDYGDKAQQSRVDTTLMHYIGFSEKSAFFAAPERRRLIAGAVDREAAAKIIGGRAALLPVNPVSEYYSAADADVYAKGDFAQKCIDALTEDYDFDGVLEYVNDGEPEDFTLDFIVCGENAGRLRAAEKIAHGLIESGFDVQLRTLGYNNFMKTLRSGKYDMYYASVRMTPDFDLTRVAGYGSGSQYGLRDTAVQKYADAFMAAEGEEKKAAAHALYSYVSEACPAVPLLFEQYAAVTERGAVSGADFTWQNFFHGITSWEVTMYVLN